MVSDLLATTEHFAGVRLPASHLVIFSSLPPLPSLQSPLPHMPLPPPPPSTCMPTVPAGHVLQRLPPLVVSDVSCSSFFPCARPSPTLCRPSGSTCPGPLSGRPLRVPSGLSQRILLLSHPNYTVELSDVRVASLPRIKHMLLPIGWPSYHGMNERHETLGYHPWPHV